MFNKVLVPMNPYDLGTSVGILPYVCGISSGLGMRVALAAVVDPEKLDLPDFFQGPGTDEGAEHMIPAGTSGIHLGAPTSSTMPVPGEEEARTATPDETTEPNTVQIIENVRFEVNRRLNRIAMRLREADIETEYMTSVTPDTAGEILRLADEAQCDLIALAAHDRGMLGQAIKGSVTNEVILDAGVPVMAITPEKSDVQPGQTAELGGILVPLDGSDFSEAALPYVEHLARNLDLEVRLVRVVEAGQVYPAAGGMVAPASREVGEVHAEMEEEAALYLQRMGEWLEGKGVRAAWEVLQGTSATSVVGIAGNEPATLVALSSHGRGGLNRLVFGSMAEELLRDISNPLLIVPPRIAELSIGVKKDWTE